MSYCPGSNCSKRDQCQKHHNQGQVIDWSTYGCGSSSINSYGDHFCRNQIYCGDNGTYGYAHFKQYIPPEEVKTNF